MSIMNGERLDVPIKSEWEKGGLSVTCGHNKTRGQQLTALASTCETTNEADSPLNNEAEVRERRRLIVQGRGKKRGAIKVSYKEWQEVASRPSQQHARFLCPRASNARSDHPCSQALQLTTDPCLFLDQRFLTRIPGQHTDAGINTSTNHSDNWRQSPEPFLPAYLLSYAVTHSRTHGSVRTEANSISHLRCCSIPTIPCGRTLEEGCIFILHDNTFILPPPSARACSNRRQSSESFLFFSIQNKWTCSGQRVPVRMCISVKRVWVCVGGCAPRVPCRSIRRVSWWTVIVGT